MNIVFILKLIGFLGSFLCVCGFIFIKSDNLVGKHFMYIGVMLLCFSVVMLNI